MEVWEVAAVLGVDRPEVVPESSGVGASSSRTDLGPWPKLRAWMAENGVASYDTLPNVVKRSLYYEGVGPNPSEGFDAQDPGSLAAFGVFQGGPDPAGFEGG